MCPELPVAAWHLHEADALQEVNQHLQAWANFPGSPEG